MGKQKARFAFYPFDSKNADELYGKALNYNTALRVIEHGNTYGSIRSGRSFFELSNNSIVLSCIKEPQDREKDNYILRLYNPTEETQVTSLKSIFTINSATETTLEEIELGKISLDSIKLEPKKIRTLKLNI